MSIDRHWRMRAARLPAMFGNDARFRSDTHTFVAAPQRVGMLHLPSGRICTGDAIATLELVPLARAAPIGDFPVDVSIATLPAGKQAIAAARVLFSPRPIADWELADEAGYTDRGGWGLIMDAEAIADYQTYYYYESVEPWEGLPTQQGDGWEYGCFQPNEQRAANCAFFTLGASGDDDGAFFSYWALDASGQPVMLATDFNVIP